MYLNIYNYFKYFCYNKMVKSNEFLIIKNVKSDMHRLSAPFVHITYRPGILLNIYISLIHMISGHCKFKQSWQVLAIIHVMRFITVKFK